MSKDMAEPEVESEITAEEVQAAQKVAGELLWVVTRTRPDLAFVTSRLASHVTRAPRWVQKVGLQAFKFLNGTSAVGLTFTPDTGVGWDGADRAGLQVYTDSSFAPGGALSHGCVMVKWQNSVIAWKSSRQGFPALSTAECELMEMIEGVVMGDAVDVLINEIEEGANYMRCLFGDNQAAIQLCAESTGAWRTRHLRLRAFHLRWRIQADEWRVRHLPGVEMIADVGTKALTGAKLKELMKLMGMRAKGESEEDIERSALARLEVSKCQGLVAVLGCCMQVQGAAAMEENPEKKDGSGDYDHLKVFGMLVAVFTVAVMKLLELLAAKAQERWGGPRIQSMRVERVEETEEVAASSSTARGSSTRRTTPRPTSSVVDGPSPTARRPSTPRLNVGSEQDPLRSSSGAGTGSGELGATAKRTTAAPSIAKGIGKTPVEPRGTAARNVDWIAVTKGYSKGYSKGYNKGTGKQATDPGRDLRPWSEPQAGSRGADADVNPASRAAGSGHQDIPEPESEDGGIPVEPSVFYTMTGEKYHARENCYGLRRATRVMETLPCPVCTTPDFRRLLFVHPGAVHITGDGLWHVLTTCAGRGVTYQPCANCRRGEVQRGLS